MPTWKKILLEDDTIPASKITSGTFPNSYTFAGAISVDTINEKTANNGVAIDGLTIKDASVKSSTPIAARVHHNANQSISNVTFTALAFSSERYDTDAIHDTSTNNSRLTCKTAGKYSIQAVVNFDNNATGVRVVTILLNGTTTIAVESRNAVNGTNTSITISTDYDLAVNDYVEVQAYQSSGGNLNVISAGNYTPEFSMHRIA